MSSSSRSGTSDARTASISVSVERYSSGVPVEADERQRRDAVLDVFGQVSEVVDDSQLNRPFVAIVRRYSSCASE